MKNNSVINEFKNRLNLYEKPTKWLNFYVRYLMMYWIIISSLMSLSALSTSYKEYHDMSATICNFIIDLGIVILTIITRNELFRFSEKGYLLNIKLNIINCVFVGFGADFVPFKYIYYIYLNDIIMGLKDILVFLLCMIFIFLIFGLPNIIYFKKRKELFILSESVGFDDFKRCNNLSSITVHGENQEQTNTK